MAPASRRSPAVDPVEAETIKLIFRLYRLGDGKLGPLGVKQFSTSPLDARRLLYPARRPLSAWRRFTAFCPTQSISASGRSTGAI